MVAAHEGVPVAQLPGGWSGASAGVVAPEPLVDVGASRAGTQAGPRDRARGAGRSRLRQKPRRLTRPPRYRGRRRTSAASAPNVTRRSSTSSWAPANRPSQQGATSGDVDLPPGQAHLMCETHRVRFLPRRQILEPFSHCSGFLCRAAANENANAVQRPSGLMSIKIVYLGFGGTARGSGQLLSRRASV